MFQKEMNGQSEEFTGNIYEKSESKMEDLIEIEKSIFGAIKLHALSFGIVAEMKWQLLT